MITEIQLDPYEAYVHLSNLLEKANSLIGSLIVRDINKESETKVKDSDTDEDGAIEMDKLIEEKENELYFAPEKGNVVFASAIDCWAFSLDTFAEILSKKIGFKKEAISKLLWGDYFFDAKKKKVYTSPINDNSRPMFVEFVLENIYKLYRMVIFEKDVEKVIKAAATLNAVLTKNDIHLISKDPKLALKVSIFINI